MDIMANLPRVEITDKALKVLKIETAISGLNQKEALEALILRGASARTLELVEGKERLPQMTLMEVERIPEIPGKPQVECKKEGEAIICAVPQVTPEARQALLFILAELERGNRPTITEIAGKLEITTVALGRMLNPLGLKAHNTHLAGKSAKVYEPSMKARIKELLDN